MSKIRQKDFKIFGFSDNIFYEKIGKKWFSGGKVLEQSFGHFAEISPLKLFIFYPLVVLILFILLGRLFMLTIVNGEKNRQIAESNRIRLVEIPAERGKIFDRRGRILADSRTVYFLKKGLQKTEMSQETAKELEASGLAGENFEGELGQILPEVERSYPNGEITAHILGYVSPVESQDLQNGRRLSGQNKVGRLGTEATYDDFLQGKNGQKIIEVDATGKKVSILQKQDQVAGRDIHLTIDLNLQKVVFEVLKKHATKAGSSRAATIVEDPKSGEVLALVSYPSFDPANVSDFLQDKNKPLFNRAVLGTYPPGSIFKIVTALAALDSGKITGESEIEDVGEFYIGDTRFVNWFYLTHGGRDGVLKINRAIARSNDIFFYKLAEKLGLNPLRKMAMKLGFGQKTGIDLPDESLGLVPDEVWKKSAFSQPWYTGDTLHFGIGQGFALSTPIQISSLISYIASGKLAKPYLVSKIDGGAGEAIDIASKIRGENLVSRENLNIVREGMRQACETGGTGWPFFNAPYKVGCKTGTAEKALGNPHAWFGAFYPFENPQISITVIIEEGGEGSSIAGPAAREILDWWISARIHPN